MNQQVKKKVAKDLLIESIRNLLHQIAPGAKAILYGSQSRTDATEDSDWDIIILLDKQKIEPSDFDIVSYPFFELGWKFGEQISPKLYTFSDWTKRSFTPFYKNVENEGIYL